MQRIKKSLLSICEMFRLLWTSSKSMTFLMLFNSIIRNALWPFRAIVVKNIVDIIVASSDYGFSYYKTSFFINIVLFFLFFWLNRIWWPLNTYTQALMLARISHNTRIRIISAIENVKLSYFDNAENADMYNRAVDQTDGRQPISMINRVFSIISLIISFGVAFTSMISISVPVSFILILSSIPSMLWEGRFNQAIYRFDKGMTKSKRIMDYIFSLFISKNSIQEIQTFRITDYLQNKHKKLLETYNHDYYKLFTQKLKIDTLFWFILQATLIVCYYIIISRVMNGVIALGSLSFFLAVAVDLQTSLRDFGSAFNDVMKSSLYFDNLLQFEKTVTSEPLLHNPVMIPNQINSIEFNHVYFTYPNSNEEILHDICFTLHNPSSVILIGENGSGKTTLLKLLLRLYQPTKGTITINGVDIQQYDLTEYYRLFSVCFQDYMKYGFSLLNNITLYKHKDQETLRHIYNETGLSNLISKLPNGEQTFLSKEYDESSVELSGGQYNMVAIARSLAKQSPIVLLDEPSAALDAIAEQKVLNIFEKLTRDHLCIMISHRLSTAVNADVILVMKNGRIIEQGKHLELMKFKGEYAKLFTIQAKQYEE